MVANEKWFGASGGFYPETIDQSVRFNDDDSPQLYKTFGSATSNTKMIYATWFKTTENSSHQTFFSGGSDSFNYMLLGLSTASFYSNSDSLFFHINTSNTTRLALRTDTTYGQFFADTSNWQHILLAIDTTQATDTNRILIFHNGKRLAHADMSFTTYPSQDYSVPLLNTAIAHNFGFNKQATNYGSFDGYFAETYFLDGQSIFSDTSGTINSTFLADATTLAMFCEQKNGVAVPKSYSGTFGNNGVKLTYADSSNIGDDTSGNGNDFTSSGLASTDIFIDTPTNNFCTLNPNFRAVTANTLSEGNLKCVTSTSGRSFNAGSFLMKPNSGKWYWEFRPDANSGGMGVAKVNGTLGANQSVTSTSTSAGSTDYYYGETNWVMYGDGIVHNATFVGGTGSGMGSPSYPQIWGIGIDMDASPPTISYYIDGSSVGSADLDTGYDYIPIVGDGSGGVSRTININFGQNPTFNGTETAGTNTDGNGNGLFHDAVPTNHLALCSSNLTTGAISPDADTQVDDNIHTIIYTGNGYPTSNGQTITGVGFQPDWTWIKVNRTGYNHYLLDSTRGATKVIRTTSTNAENTEPTSLTSWNADGFVLGANNEVNYQNDTIASWNWLGGGTAPTKTYKVVVVSDSGNKYRFRNSADSATFAQSAVTLDLQEGGTYVFDWSDSSAQGHPIRFSTTSDGTHGGGSAYTTGVVNDDSNYKTTITVASSAPTLYYYCANHSGMGGQINTNSTHGSTNFDGTILSISQTNETAGFSIIKYTGTGVAGTIGHGLGKTPALLLTKNISWSHEYSAWLQWHHKRDNAFNASTNYGYLNLTTTGGTTTTSFYRGDQINTTTYGIYTNDAINDASYNYICYAFTEIAGYSQFGTYEGNGNADNAYIYCGFTPKYLLIKNIDASSDWVIRDEHNSGYYTRAGNPKSIGFEANTTKGHQGAIAWRVDFLSNGFKIRSTQTDLGASNTYYYWAFGNDFKFSNGQ